MYNIEAIKKHLKKDIKYLLEKSDCKKWHNWFNEKDTPYPCVCPVRGEHCIELELYYELQKVVRLYHQKAYFKQAIEEFSYVNKHDIDAILSWVEKHKLIGSQLFFNPTITIFRSTEKDDKLIVELNPDEFSTVIQFQELFNTVYYSEEYQINTNL